MLRLSIWQSIQTINIRHKTRNDLTTNYGYGRRQRVPKTSECFKEYVEGESEREVAMEWSEDRLDY